MPNEKKLTFPNQHGDLLAGVLTLPSSEPAGTALFAHCFRCTKNLAAARQISQALARSNIATLRFDFTGLGNSGGDFANTNFSSNVQDLVCAANYLRTQRIAPDFLIGHSLGGSAVLAAAHHVPECNAVVTIGSPATGEHVIEQFQCDLPSLKKLGEATVVLAGHKFRIKKQFYDDIVERNMANYLRDSGRALLIFHSPVDEVVNVQQARLLFEAAAHPKSFISLDSADHLLSKAVDARYVATLINGWVRPHLSSQSADTRTI